MARAIGTGVALLLGALLFALWRARAGEADAPVEPAPAASSPAARAPESAEALLAQREALAFEPDSRAAAPGALAPAAPGPESLTVSVRILDREARALAGATLSRLVPGPDLVPVSAGRASADATGATWLRLGRDELDPSQSLVLALEAEGHARQCLDLEPARWTAGPMLNLGEVMLAPGGTLTGRVVDSAGTGLEGALVALSAELGESTPLEREMARLWPLIEPPGSEIPLLARSAADGAFTLAGAPTGRFALVAVWVGELDPLLPGRIEGLLVRPGETTPAPDLVLVAARPEELVRGLVRAPDGTPFDGAVITLSDEADQQRYSAFARSRADGRFGLPAPGETTFTLRARDPGGRWLPSTAVRGRAGGPELELRFEAEVGTPPPRSPAAPKPPIPEQGPARLRGRLTLGGEPPGSWSAGVGSQSSILDHAGDFELDGLSAGSVQLVLSPGRGAIRRVLSLPIELQAGANEWDLDLPVGDLALEHLPPVEPLVDGPGQSEWADFALEQNENGRYFVLLFPGPTDARAAFEDAPAGPFVLRYRGPGSRPDSLDSWPIAAEFELRAGERKTVVVP